MTIDVNSEFHRETVRLASTDLLKLMGPTIEQLKISGGLVFPKHYPPKTPGGSFRDLWDFYDNYGPTEQDLDRDAAMNKLAKELGTRVPQGYDLIVSRSGVRLEEQHRATDCEIYSHQQAEDARRKAHTNGMNRWYESFH